MHCAKRSCVCVNKIQKLTLLDDFLAERAVVLEEALAGLDAEPAGANHLAHQRMRTVLRVAGLAVQRLHDCEVYVVANKVSGVQRAGLHAGAELHSNVDVSRGSDAVSNDTHSLVHHRDEDAVYDEARALVNGNRSLAQRSHQIERGLEGLIRGLKCAGNLNQLHDLSRVEEVAADELVRTVRNACSHFGYGQGGGVGSEDGVLRADLVQLLEQVLLQVHALQNNFHDEVSVGSGVAVYRGLEGSKQLVLVLCGHLALAYEELVIVCDNGLAALGELRSFSAATHLFYHTVSGLSRTF